MKITKHGIFWSKLRPHPKTEDDYFYYFYFPSRFPTSCGWCWGYEWIPYDCQIHECFNFGFFNISWSTSWSNRKWKKM